jgi:hypothetical protein
MVYAFLLDPMLLREFVLKHINYAYQEGELDIMQALADHLALGEPVSVAFNIKSNVRYAIENFKTPGHRRKILLQEVEDSWRFCHRGSGESRGQHPRRTEQSQIELRRQWNLFA